MCIASALPARSCLCTAAPRPLATAQGAALFSALLCRVLPHAVAAELPACDQPALPAPSLTCPPPRRVLPDAVAAAAGVELLHRRQHQAAGRRCLDTGGLFIKRVDEAAGCKADAQPTASSCKGGLRATAHPNCRSQHTLPRLCAGATCGAPPGIICSAPSPQSLWFIPIFCPFVALICRRWT